VKTLIATCLLALCGGAANAATILPIPVGYPTLLGASCGGVHVSTYVTGFDVNGNIAGEVYAWTRCGGSGRGGGYKSHTYSSWHSILWDFYGNFVLLPYDGTVPDPLFTATDAYGNTISDTPLASVDVVQIPPTAPNLNPPVTVPDVTGLDYLTAQDALTAAGFTIGGYTYVSSDTIHVDAIVSETPSGGTTATIQTLIYLMISSGPVPVDD